MDQGQSHGHFRELPRLGLDLDGASVAPHDVAGEGQTQAGSLVGRFRGEEGRIASVSSLSGILEETVPIASLLTAANCAGIIRREENNGRTVSARFRKALDETIRLWCNVGEALGTPESVVFAPRYVPKAESIREVIRTGQYSVARNLTWREWERLMGFPDDWTVVVDY